MGLVRRGTGCLEVRTRATVGYPPTVFSYPPTAVRYPPTAGQVRYGRDVLAVKNRPGGHSLAENERLTKEHVKCSTFTRSSTVTVSAREMGSFSPAWPQHLAT